MVAMVVMFAMVIKVATVMVVMLVMVVVVNMVVIVDRIGQDRTGRDSCDVFLLLQMEAFLITSRSLNERPY